MKIGILTLPLHTNYGGILQAYALQTILSRMGHEVRVLDYDNTKPLKIPILQAPFVYSKRILKNLLGKKICVFYEYVYNRNLHLIRQHTNAFIKNRISRYPIKKFSQIRKDDFDAFVVGSDQVWRPKYFESLFKSSIDNAYLSFTKGWDVLRYSYAASFGVDVWEYSDKQTRECSNYLANFNAVAVRERSAVELCADKFNISANHVLDPTMLLSQEDYLSLIPLNRPRYDGQIMTYLLDQTDAKMHLVNLIEKETGYKSFSTKSPSYSENITELIVPPVERWIQGFRDANLIITDSFHACVFSIIFKKPFLVLINSDRGATRFKSLLKLYNLEDRILRSNQILTKDYIERPIPSSVYDIMDKFKLESMEFLNQINNEDFSS